MYDNHSEVVQYFRYLVPCQLRIIKFLKIRHKNFMLVLSIIIKRNSTMALERTKSTKRLEVLSWTGSHMLMKAAVHVGGYHVHWVVWDPKLKHILVAHHKGSNDHRRYSTISNGCCLIQWRIWCCYGTPSKRSWKTYCIYCFLSHNGNHWEYHRMLSKAARQHACNYSMYWKWLALFYRQWHLW